MQVIHCKCGSHILVDDGDFSWLSSLNIHCAESGVCVWNGIKLVNLGSLLLGITDANLEPDHIDRDKHNNTRSNLRVASHAQNNANRNIQNNNTSGYKGVVFDKTRNKWIAQLQITVDGKRKNVHLGRFSTKERAAEAYNKGAVEYFGEFAHLNYIVKET